ncbi:hypothetical protein [Salinibacter altiplanensis]|uniref:hypothetical protein n=1 Tax=Salinibacter altiplanensis TaxID=1803181 RepID=UPI000C9FC5FA|nr:hypothetical protein [Salinibacter altiplanensis]
MSRPFTAVAMMCLLACGCSLVGSDDAAPSVEWVDFEQFASDTTALRGEWGWRRTVCCFGDLGVSTPRSTGRTETVLFTDRDTVEVYRDGRLKRQATYGAYLENAQWGVRADTFAISRAFLDGPESVYVRLD